MFGMEHETMDLVDLKTFETEIQEKGKFHYIYLCTHANIWSFGEADSSKTFRWDDFASSLCNSNCLEASACLLLACCRGGLKQVANTLFVSCIHIDYICGPRWTLTGPDLSTAFHVFIYNMESRKEQPSTAAERMSKATGYDFFVYDRVETEDKYVFTT
jgi:hypothetical protein